VGGAAAYAFSLSVPGGAMPAAGITHVGVLPTHRRQGLLKQLMHAQFSASHERGEAIAMLWASEAAIYQRFGFGIGTWSQSYEAQGARLKDDGGGRVGLQFLETDEAERSLPSIYARAIDGRTGTVRRDGTWWQSRLGSNQESAPFVLATRDEEHAGYAIYRMSGSWPNHFPEYELEIEELMATTPVALRTLWATLFTLDLVRTVRAEMRPIDDPVLHLVTEPRRLRVRVVDGVWVRLLDVKAALEARSFAAQGSVRIRVSDELIPSNAGTWELEPGAMKSAVRRSRRSPEVSVDVAALSSAFLGGASFGSLARAGLAVEHEPGALARLDRFFAISQPPWCPQWF
jgi:predicted acetyltransferase